MKKGDKEPDLSDVIGGTLNILGLKIDLAKLLSSPEEVSEGLQDLRERLKRAGGKEVLGDEEWRRGETSISGYFRTRGILGEREYHIGIHGQPGAERRTPRAAKPPEVIEPPIDLFDEPHQVIIVADIPGVSLDDLELEVQGGVLSLSTKPKARRSYHKDIPLGAEVDPSTLKATCRNGVLAVRLRKQGRSKK